MILDGTPDVPAFHRVGDAMRPIRRPLSNLAITLAIMLVSSARVSAFTFNVESALQIGQTSRWAILDGGAWAKVEGGMVRFLSPDSQELQTLDLKGSQFLVAPTCGQVVGVISYADPQPKNLNALMFDLYDASGTRLVRVENPRFSSAIVARSGTTFVGIDGAEGLPFSVLRFFDGQGNRLDTLPVDRFEGGRFSRDGSRFFFITATDGLCVRSIGDASQEQFGRVEQWAASSDGRIVVTAAGGNINSYRDGRLVTSFAWRADSLPLRAVGVSPDGEYAAAISAVHAGVFRTDSSALLWTVASAEPGWNIRSVDLRNGLSLVAVGVDYDPGPDSVDRHMRSRCDVYDRVGRLVHSEEDQPEKWGAYFPEVRFDDSRGGLVFINRDRFKYIKIGLP